MVSLQGVLSNNSVYITIFKRWDHSTFIKYFPFQCRHSQKYVCKIYEKCNFCEGGDGFFITRRSTLLLHHSILYSRNIVSSHRKINVCMDPACLSAFGDNFNIIGYRYLYRVISLTLLPFLEKLRLIFHLNVNYVIRTV